MDLAGPGPILAGRPDPEGQGAAASAAGCQFLPSAGYDAGYEAGYEAENADGHRYAVGEDPEDDLSLGDACPPGVSLAHDWSSG